MKKCPFCAEEIQNEAIKCKHCGEVLGKQTDATKRTVRIEKKEKTLRVEKPAWLSYWLLIVMGIGFILFGLINSVSPNQSGSAVVFLLGCGVVCILPAVISRQSMTYTITSKRIIVRIEFLLYKSDEIDIPHIRCVSLSQGILGNMFDYGNICIGTAGTAGYEIVIKNINSPQKIVALIKSLQK